MLNHVLARAVAHLPCVLHGHDVVVHDALGGRVGSYVAVHANWWLSHMVQMDALRIQHWSADNSLSQHARSQARNPFLEASEDTSRRPRLLRLLWTVSRVLCSSRRPLIMHRGQVRVQCFRADPLSVVVLFELVLTELHVTELEDPTTVASSATRHDATSIVGECTARLISRVVGLVRPLFERGVHVSNLAVLTAEIRRYSSCRSNTASLVAYGNAWGVDSLRVSLTTGHGAELGRERLPRVQPVGGR